VSTDDPQRTQEWNAPPEDELEPLEAARARQAELRAELAETDARRAEEEVGRAHDEVEAAEHQEEKLSRKERKLRKRAAEAEAAAAEALRRAQEASRPAPEPSLSGAHVTSPGLGSDTDPASAASAASGGTAAHASSDRMAAAQGALEHPEVQVGLAFAGAFLAARILKRIFD
jgi:chromosome segregation ATPase